MIRPDYNVVTLRWGDRHRVDLDERFERIAVSVRHREPVTGEAEHVGMLSAGIDDTQGRFEEYQRATGSRRGGVPGGPHAGTGRRLPASERGAELLFINEVTAQGRQAKCPEGLFTCAASCPGSRSRCPAYRGADPLIRKLGETAAPPRPVRHARVTVPA